MVRATATAALLGSVSIACGDNGSGEGRGAVIESPHLGDATEQPVTVSEGGEVALVEAGIELSVPAGALAEDTMITAQVVSKLGLAEAGSIAGDVVELGPDGLTFAQPVTLTLDLAGARIAEDARVVMAWYDEQTQTWIDLAGSTFTEDKVTAQTTHFTMYAVHVLPGEGFQASGLCPEEFSACGGDVEGTWNIVSSCAEADAFTSDEGPCEGASIRFGLDVTGHVSLAGGYLSGTLIRTSEQVEVLPKACIGGACPQPDREDPEAIVFEDLGETCEATLRTIETQTLEDTYILQGDQITTSKDGETSPETGEFCVQGDTLTLNGFGEGGEPLRWTARRK